MTCRHALLKVMLAPRVNGVGEPGGGGDGDEEVRSFKSILSIVGNM